MDTLASEYGQHPSEIRQLPLAEALCYFEAILQRNDARVGHPSFAERDLLSELNA